MRITYLPLLAFLLSLPTDAAGVMPPGTALDGDSASANLLRYWEQSYDTSFGELTADDLTVTDVMRYEAGLMTATPLDNLKTDIDTAIAVKGQTTALVIAQWDDEVGTYSKNVRTITCWGYETSPAFVSGVDEDYELNSVYITDAQDGYNGVVRLDIRQKASTGLANYGYMFLSSNDVNSAFCDAASGYVILNVESIATPAATAQSAVATASALPESGIVSENTYLATPSVTRDSISVGSMATLSVKGGSISLSRLETEAGSMLSANGLDTLSVSNTGGDGLQLAGNTYLCNIIDLNISHNQGAGLQSSAHLEISGSTLAVGAHANTTTISDNAGGGIRSTSSLSLVNDDAVTISNNSISGETALGGGICSADAVWKETPVFTLGGNSATATGALAAGGALYSTGKLTVSGSSTDTTALSFTENAVRNTGNGAACGGALALAAGSTTTIRGLNTLSFLRNTATAANGQGQGGAIFNAGTLTISELDALNFTDNTAEAGSAICNIGTLRISGNKAVTFSTAGTGSSIVNTGTLEIIGNDKDIAIVDAANVSIENSGELYLAADGDLGFTLSGKLRSSGTTHIGTDAEGHTSSGYLQMKDDNGAFISLASGSLQGAELSMDGIRAYGAATADLEELNILCSADFTAAGASLSACVIDASGNMTLSDVTLDDRCMLTYAEKVTLDHVTLTLDLTQAQATSATACTLTLGDLFYDRVDGSLHMSGDLSTLTAAGYETLTVDFGDYAYFTTANALSLNNGAAVLNSTDSSVTFALMPEPSSAALALLAMSGLALRRRR